MIESVRLHQMRSWADGTVALTPGAHIFWGENGAGKSTLIKVLTGVYKKNSGSVKFFGKDFEASSPMDAARKGISTVYQEINLLPNLSIAENIFIGRQPMKATWVSLRG